MAYFLLSEDGSDPVIADVLRLKLGQIERVATRMQIWWSVLPEAGPRQAPRGCIRCRSFKQAKANATVVVLRISLFGRNGEAPWRFWVPALAQVTMTGPALKGEALTAAMVLPASVTCPVEAGLCITFVAKALAAAVKS